jgi:hypothetical protein
MAAALVLALVGCGAQVGGEAGGGSSPSSPTVSASSASASTASVPGSPSASASPPGETTTTSPGVPAKSEPVGTPVGPVLVLDGVATAGVELGCVVFSAKGTLYLLMGWRGRVPLDVPIRVRGQVLTDVLSYCQQGTPLSVIDVTRR